MQNLSRDEVKRLLHNIPNGRQRAMVLTTYLHGLRVSETIGLTKENIRDGYISVQRLKGSLKTIQPYVSSSDPDLNEAIFLSKMSGTLKPGERVFPMTRSGFLKLMKRAGTRAGLPEHKLHPHALKHSIALELIDNIGIQNLKKYLGHKSLGSTGAYLEVSDQKASNAVAGVFNSQGG